MKGCFIVKAKEKRNSFSSSIGFVLAAAGSAVGLGNIWRFPYLAAKDGGGLFLVVYLILALTFGFTMLVSEVSIGRKTKQSELIAYSSLYEASCKASKRSVGKPGSIFTRLLGLLAAVVPFLILPYYCIIGGWVLKYCVIFCTGQGNAAAESIVVKGSDGLPVIGANGEIETTNLFSQFIVGYWEPILFTVIFILAAAAVVFIGVNKGIEALSKILMPILLVFVLGIAIFSLTIQGTQGRTGLDGFAKYLIPSLDGMGAKEVIDVVLDAMGQLFYSISVAMGIMITYGSYFKDDSNLMRSVNQIEIFDTAVAFLAGVMIIPAVFAFLGDDGLKNSGPGLMFIALPKVFQAMGWIGNIVGAVFFIMVFFAALTSAISILEAVVASIMDRFGCKRRTATAIETVIALAIGIVICLGYNVLSFEIVLPTGSKANLLDLFDYLSNNILMPLVAIGTCVLIGWMVRPKTVTDEATKNGEKFGRRAMYVVMIKFVAPIMLVALLMVSLGVIR